MISDKRLWEIQTAVDAGRYVYRAKPSKVRPQNVIETEDWYAACWQARGNPYRISLLLQIRRSAVIDRLRNDSDLASFCADCHETVLDEIEEVFLNAARGANADFEECSRLVARLRAADRVMATRGASRGYVGYKRQEVPKPKKRQMTEEEALEIARKHLDELRGKGRKK